MRQTFVWVASVAIILACVAPVWAQRTVVADPFSVEDDLRLLSLINKRDVQLELGLTTAQMEELGKSSADLTAYMNQVMQDGKLSDRDKATRSEASKEYNSRRSKVVALFFAMLGEKQRARLAELRIQNMGHDALLTAAVAERLQLTAAQQKELQRIGTEYTENMRRILEQQENREQSRDERNKLQAKRSEDLIAVLTDEQKSAFDALQGAKFDFNRMRNESQVFLRSIEIVNLMSDMAVQTELTLTEEQKVALRKIQTQSRPERPVFGARGRQNRTPEEIQEQLQESKDRSARAASLILGMLTPEQTTRFEEIRLQQQGLRVLLSPEVIQNLKLSSDQTSQLRKIIDGAQDADWRARRLEPDEEMTAAAMSVLTAEQKATFDAMLGRKFKRPARAAPNRVLPGAT